MKVTHQGKEVEVTPVEIISQEEQWNQYQLLDGTVVRLKVVVTEILKVVGQFDNFGNPVYLVRSDNVTMTRPVD